MEVTQLIALPRAGPTPAAQGASGQSQANGQGFESFLGQAMSSDGKGDTTVAELLAAGMAACMLMPVLPSEQAAIQPEGEVSVEAAGTVQGVAGSETTLPVVTTVAMPETAAPNTQQTTPATRPVTSTATQEAPAAQSQGQTVVAEEKPVMAADKQSAGGATVSVEVAGKSPALAINEVEVSANTNTAASSETKQPFIKSVESATEQIDVSAHHTSSVKAMASYETFNVSQEAPLDLKQPQLVKQVSEKIKDLAGSGQTTLRIQVVPESLGRIDLRLVSNSNGVQVIMTADLPSTGRLLESHLAQLQQSLAEAGLQIGNLSVGGQGLPGHSNEAFDGQPFTTQFPVQVKVASPLTEEEIGSGRVSDPVLSLDYRV